MTDFWIQQGGGRSQTSNSATSKSTNTQRERMNTAPRVRTDIYRFRETGKLGQLRIQKNLQDQKPPGCGQAAGRYKGSSRPPGRPDQDLPPRETARSCVGTGVSSSGKVQD